MYKRNERKMDDNKEDTIGSFSITSFEQLEDQLRKVHIVLFNTQRIENAAAGRVEADCLSKSDSPPRVIDTIILGPLSPNSI